MKFRPSKSFLRLMFVLVPLLAAAIIALWPIHFYENLKTKSIAVPEWKRGQR